MKRKTTNPNLLVKGKKKSTNLIFISAITSLLFTITIIGCQKEIATETPTHNTFLTKDFDNIGVMHNKDLDELYTGLKNLKANNSTILDSTRTQYIDIVKNLLTDQIKSENFSDKEKNIIFSVFSSHSKTLSTVNVSYLSSSPQSHKLYEEYANSLTTNQKQILDELQLILSKNETVLEMTKSIEDLEKSAATRVDEKELFVIYCATSVAKSTSKYWYENLSKWQMLKTKDNIQVNSIKTLKTSSYGWNDLIGDDVAGAVGGAVGAAIVNLVPGPGQIAYGTAIAGGAAANSVTGFVKSLF